MRTISVRPQGSRVSIASRVVPGMSETIIRSWPSSALSRLDLPTFGRPTSAIAGGSSSDSLAMSASHLRRGILDRPVGRLARPRRPASSSVSSSSPTTYASSRPASTSRENASASVSRCLRASSASDSGGSASDDLVEQVRDAAAVDRGDRVGPLPAEGVELGRLELALRVVALVDGDEDRRLRPPQQLGRLLVGGRQARDRLDDEDDDVRLGDRDPGLVLDARLDRVAAGRPRGRPCRRS